MTKGKFAYDWADEGKMTPVSMMHTLGHGFIPSGIHAGGLRHHGMSPVVSALTHNGYIEARAVPQLATLKAGVQFSKTEGIIPAPESAHAIRVAIDEALRCKATGEKKVIAFIISGHGHFDMAAYHAFHEGQLKDHDHATDEIDRATQFLPSMPSA